MSFREVSVHCQHLSSFHLLSLLSGFPQDFFSELFLKISSTDTCSSPGKWEGDGGDCQDYPWWGNGHTCTSFPAGILLPALSWDDGNLTEVVFQYWVLKYYTNNDLFIQIRS